MAAGEERGQGLVEYGMLIMLIAVVLIGVLMVLGGPIGAVYSSITTSVP